VLQPSTVGVKADGVSGVVDMGAMGVAERTVASNGTTIERTPPVNVPLT